MGNFLQKYLSSNKLAISVDISNFITITENTDEIYTELLNEKMIILNGIKTYKSCDQNIIRLAMNNDTEENNLKALKELIHPINYLYQYFYILKI